jgi:hypothetical protein
MKKLLIVPILVCLFASCNGDYLTEHSFSIRNLSSDTLELRYKKGSMDTIFDTSLEPYVYPTNSYFTNYVQSGKEDRLSNDTILHLFEIFEFIKETDTIRLDSTTIKKWLTHHDKGVVEFGYKQHYYAIEVTDEDLE